MFGLMKVSKRPVETGGGVVFLEFSCGLDCGVYKREKPCISFSDLKNLKSFRGCGHVICLFKIKAVQKSFD